MRLVSYIWWLLRMLVNTNLFISIGAVCMVLQTYLLLGHPLQVTPLLVLVFSATLFVYNWHRLLSHNKPTYGSMEGMHGWMEAHIWWTRSAIVLGALGMSVSVWWLSRQAQVTLLILGVVSTIYALPVPLSKGYRIRLRDIGMLKPAILAAVWAFATAFLPILDRGVDPFSSIALFIIAKRFLFIFAICIPFDIKDMEYDRKTMRYPTLPIIVGPKATKWLAVLTLVAFQVLVLVYDGFTPTGWGLTASFFYTFVAIMFPTKNESEYYYTFGIDSTMIVQFVLVLLAVKFL